MTHHICTGECGGVSDKPGVCQAGTCSKKGEPLTPCQCLDPKHGRQAEGQTPEEGQK